MDEKQFNELIETLPIAHICPDWDNGKMTKEVDNYEMFNGEYLVYFDAKVECIRGENPKIEMHDVDILTYESGEDMELTPEQKEFLKNNIKTNLIVE